MTKSIRPANAGAITRSLVAAGFRRGEEHKASRGMVRGGWSTFTEGITSTQAMKHGRQQVRQGSYRDGTPRYGWLTNNTPTGYVVVEYQFGSWDKRGQAERNAKAAEVLDRAAEHLRDQGVRGRGHQARHHRRAAAARVPPRRRRQRGEVLMRGDMQGPLPQGLHREVFHVDGKQYVTLRLGYKFRTAEQFAYAVAAYLRMVGRDAKVTREITDYGTEMVMVSSSGAWFEHNVILTVSRRTRPGSRWSLGRLTVYRIGAKDITARTYAEAKRAIEVYAR